MNKLYKRIMESFSSRFPKAFSDLSYIKLKYKLRFNRDINLSEPTGFNEKLNWLKLYYRNPKFTMMADKYWVKQYVAEKIGEQYVVPCYGYWKSVNEIEYDKLPDKVFLKSTHDSGGGILVDKTRINLKRIRKRFNRKTLIGKNWYWNLREYPYLHIEPGIIAEEYLDEGTGCELHDYKFSLVSKENL